MDVLYNICTNTFSIHFTFLLVSDKETPLPTSDQWKIMNRIQHIDHSLRIIQGKGAPGEVDNDKVKK